MRAVQPVAHKLSARAAFALRDLRFVMREDIVHAAAVDIEFRPEQRGRHGAALDVPAGPARPPGRVPAHVAILVVPRFPEREVAHAFLLVLVVLDAAGGPQFIEIQVRQLSIVGELREAEIDGSVLRLIGDAPASSCWIISIIFAM